LRREIFIVAPSFVAFGAERQPLGKSSAHLSFFPDIALGIPKRMIDNGVY
jgi:hypothetical protein